MLKMNEINFIKRKKCQRGAGVSPAFAAPRGRDARATIKQDNRN